jgi:hypothetical protein
MSPRTVMIVFSVGTTVGTGLFMLCNRTDDPGFIDLPKGAKIVRSNESEIWFDAPGATLRSIATINHMEVVKGRYTTTAQYFKRTLDKDDGHFHAKQEIAMDGSDDLSRMLKN